jgi:16S rRNA (guanine527-N7)-methyltransferase
VTANIDLNGVSEGSLRRVPEHASAQDRPPPVRYTYRPRSTPRAGVEEKQLRTAVAAALDDLNLDMPSGADVRLARFVALIEKWNKVYNLTAVRDPLDMVSRHVVDSLVVASRLCGNRIADVGTGAGLPGIPLAIARPECRFILIDSAAKKTRFVTHAAGKLGLENVSVAHCRVENYAGPAAFDTVVSRAFAAPGEFAALAGHLCRHDGCLLAMMGKVSELPAAGLPAEWGVESLERLTVPGSDAERHLLLMRREAKGKAG